MGGQRLPFLQRLLSRRVLQGVPALHNRLMEQSFCKRGGQQREHAARARGFAKQGHISGIAAKPGDVIPLLFERGDLIQQGKIMHHAIFLAFQRGMGKKAKMTETVVDRHHNHAARGQRFAVIGR